MSATTTSRAWSFAIRHSRMLKLETPGAPSLPSRSSVVYFPLQKDSAGCPEFSGLFTRELAQHRQLIELRFSETSLALRVCPPLLFDRFDGPPARSDKDRSTDGVKLLRCLKSQRCVRERQRTQCWACRRLRRRSVRRRRAPARKPTREREPPSCLPECLA